VWSGENSLDLINQGLPSRHDLPVVFSYLFGDVWRVNVMVSEPYDLLLALKPKPLKYRTIDRHEGTSGILHKKKHMLHFIEQTANLTPVPHVCKYGIA
jgi:hypothetical protein